MPKHPPLRHLHIPGITTYRHASQLQSILFHFHLLYKAQQSKSKLYPPPSFTSASEKSEKIEKIISTPPSPYIITSQFQPVYTLGRREVAESPPEGIKQLLSDKQAELLYTPRGGRITFHGPGQIVTYPVIDLKRHGLTPRCYIRFIEDSVISVLKTKYGVKGFTNDEAGVWTRDDRKIASVGVNLRRWVSSHGVSVNVDVDLAWFGRIVACGLEGVEMWSVKREMEEMMTASSKEGGDLVVPSAVEVGKELLDEIARGLDCDGVEEVEEEEVWEIGRKYGISGEEDGIVNVGEKEVDPLTQR